MVDDISHEGLRVLLRDEGVSFQAVKTWKASADPDYEAKKARVEHLYAIADREIAPEPGEPEVIWCSLHPADVRVAIIYDNYSPHLSTKKDTRVGDWAEDNNVEIACTPTNSSWLNRIEAQFTALRYFTLNGTDHRSHKEQASMIRRYIIWRNQHAYDERLRRIVARANAA